MTTIFTQVSLNSQAEADGLQQQKNRGYTAHEHQDIQVVGSELGLNNMKAWAHPAVCQWCVMKKIFLATFGPQYQLNDFTLHTSPPHRTCLGRN